MTLQDLPLPLDRIAELPDGMRLHYLDSGQGPVVVWLHGSGPGASGHSNFKGNYPAFAAAGFRNIVLDLPGFGRSDKPADAHYNLDFFVSRLSAFLEVIGVNRCTLLGNSLGGAIALGQALARPDLVERLILMARAAWKSGKPISRWKASSAWWPPTPPARWAWSRCAT